MTVNQGSSRLPSFPGFLRLLSGGSDETRTHDLRRDRRQVQLMISIADVILRSIQVEW